MFECVTSLHTLFHLPYFTCMYFIFYYDFCRSFPCAPTIDFWIISESATSCWNRCALFSSFLFSAPFLYLPSLLFFSWVTGPEGSERILGDEATVFPSILLPVRRRTARNSFADERPDSSTTALAKVLRKHRQSTLALYKLTPFQAQPHIRYKYVRFCCVLASIRGGFANHKDVLCGRRRSPFQANSLPSWKCGGLAVGG